MRIPTSVIPASSGVTSVMETSKEDWMEEFDNLYNASGFDHIDTCGCLGECKCTPKRDRFKNFISQLLSTQEEKIFKQLETIDIKMGDPDAELKIKFAIKAMIRHIKLKKEKDDSTPSINTDSATQG